MPRFSLCEGSCGVKQRCEHYGTRTRGFRDHIGSLPGLILLVTDDDFARVRETDAKFATHFHSIRRGNLIERGYGRLDARKGFLSVSLVRRAHCGILSQRQLRYKSLAAVTKPPETRESN